MEQGVIVSKIAGEVFLKEGSIQKPLAKSVKLGVCAKCEVNTSDSSYAVISEKSDPDSKKKGWASITIFPKSKVVVHTGRGFIKEVEVLQGLTNVSVSEGKKILTPTAEFQGAAWVDVASDGRTVVAHSRDTIYNRKTRRAVTLDVNQQVLITEDSIGEPEPMDQRFHQAQKTMFNLGAFAGAEMYRQVAEKADALFEAYLIGEKAMATKTGQEFEKLKEEAKQTFLKQKQWAQTEAKKYQQEAEKITKTDFSTSSVIPINQSVKYQDVELKILSVKREAKSEGKDLLSIQIKAKNESQKQIFIFWNEESRLINEKGEIFLTEDYDLETSFERGTQVKGYLFIPVSKQDEKFKLQLGKKSLPKVELELDLSQTKKGG